MSDAQKFLVEFTFSAQVLREMSRSLQNNSLQREDLGKALQFILQAKRNFSMIPHPFDSQTSLHLRNLGIPGGLWLNCNLVSSPLYFVQ